MDEDSGSLIDISGNGVNAYPYGCPTYNIDGFLYSRQFEIRDLVVVQDLK